MGSEMCIRDRLRSPVNDVKEEVEETRVKVEVKEEVLESSCQRMPVRRDMGAGRRAGD